MNKLLFNFFSRVTYVIFKDGEILPSIIFVGCRVIVKTRIFDFNDDLIVRIPSFFSFCASIIVQ